MQKHITVFTDGSTTAMSSSWAACYGDDAFMQSYMILPSDAELSLRQIQFTSLTCVGDAISSSVSSGIYTA